MEFECIKGLLGSYLKSRFVYRLCDSDLRFQGVKCAFIIFNFLDWPIWSQVFGAHYLLQINLLLQLFNFQLRFNSENQTKRPAKKQVRGSLPAADKVVKAVSPCRQLFLVAQQTFARKLGRDGGDFLGQISSRDYGAASQQKGTISVSIVKSNQYENRKSNNKLRQDDKTLQSYYQKHHKHPVPQYTLPSN